MVQQYKFITSGSVGTMQLYPSGEVVTVFSGSDGDISVQGDFVCFTADTKRYTIAFGDVIKSDNTPCATVNEAATYVGAIIATYAGGGGGGGGDATALNQTTQITAANLTNTTLGAIADSPSTAPTANKSIVAIIKGFWQTFGEQTDTALATPATTGTLMGVLRGIWTKLNASVAVTGTFWQATQPVSAASLPLPSGAATSANQTNGQQISNPTQFTHGTPVNVTTVGVGTTAFALISASASRRGIILHNKTNNTVYITLGGSTPVGGTGSAAVYDYSILSRAELKLTDSACSGVINAVFAASPNGNGITLTQLT